MTIGEYVELVESAHQARGAIAGQRDVLTTTTAKRIRQRMVADVKLGAVLPPVVIGAVIPAQTFEDLPVAGESINDVLEPTELESLSIIDGMQRTAAIISAAHDDAIVSNRKLRVEFWLATNVRAMIYRMLVLNTGQVPWTISRQLSVVYKPLLNEVLENVPELDKMTTPDSPGRRVAAAQYSSDAVVELYIAFSLRKTAVDAKEAVSDEFSRLDFVDNLADVEFQGQFYGALKMLAGLDRAFSRFDNGSGAPFSKGRNIFDRQPARIGLIVAIGTYVLGRPGADREPDDRAARLAELDESHAALIERLGDLDHEQLGEFLRLDVLSEVLDRKVGQVGRYDRGVFSEAFKVLIDEDFSVPNLEPCWRAA